MYKIEIDNFIFHVNVTEYSQAIPGSYSYNADSDMDYYGCAEEFDWECFRVDEILDSGKYVPLDCKDTLDIVDLFAEQITEQILDKLKFEQEYVEGMW